MECLLSRWVEDQLLFFILLDDLIDGSSQDFFFFTLFHIIMVRYIYC